MDRILRTVPFGVSLAILTMAIVGMRWAIGCPSRSRVMAEPPSRPVAAAPAPAQPSSAAPLRLLSAEEAPEALLPTPPSTPITPGPADQVSASAAEPASPGPQLTAPPVETVEKAAASPAASPILEHQTAEPASVAEVAETVPQSTPWPGARSSALPTADVGAERSDQLEQIAQQADRQIQHGFDLAERGAYFAARSEFVASLRLVAEGLDTERKCDVHGRALAAALTALKESEDFLPLGSRVETDLDIANAVASHNTPVLRDSPDDKVTPMVASRTYLTYAQEQFAAAVDHEVAGSMALYAMGKLHATLAQKKSAPIVAAEGKAVVFFQAAMMAYPKNYMAANDLGVLLARCGNYGDARTMLEFSVSLGQQAPSWRNLAVVYRQLGLPAQAEYAVNQATALQQGGQSGRTSFTASVQWIDSQTFAQTSPNMSTVPGACPQSAAVSGQANSRTTTANRGAVERTARSSVPPSRWWGSQSATNEAPQEDARPQTNAPSPAPTPAAASRMPWGASPYQR